MYVPSNFALSYLHRRKNTKASSRSTSKIASSAVVLYKNAKLESLRVLHYGNSDGWKVSLSISSEPKGTNWPFIRIKWRVYRMLPGVEFVIVL
jgi:hypothetical protein